MSFENGWTGNQKTKNIQNIHARVSFFCFRKHDHTNPQTRVSVLCLQLRDIWGFVRLDKGSRGTELWKPGRRVMKAPSCACVQVAFRIV